MRAAGTSPASTRSTPTRSPSATAAANLRRITLDLANTGYIRAEVTSGGRDLQAYEFFGLPLRRPLLSHFDTAPTRPPAGASR
jgi:hypothetical protein